MDFPAFLLLPVLRRSSLKPLLLRHIHKFHKSLHIEIKRLSKPQPIFAIGEIAMNRMAILNVVSHRRHVGSSITDEQSTLVLSHEAEQVAWLLERIVRLILILVVTPRFPAHR